jgi:prepilin-type N-terminal cleavage/methylation domain-containing protein
MQSIQMSRGRRGFTMIEVLVALVLLGIVSAALYRVLANNQRLYMAQTQRIDLSQNIRAASTILPAEFRELDAFEGDITAMSATSISIRAMRWVGFACNTPVLGGALSSVSVIVRGGAPGQPLFFGSRAIDNAKDQILIYYDGDKNSRLDDFWATATITAAPNGQNCDDGTNGQRLLLNINLLGLGANLPGAIPLGAPVRGWEPVTYQLYRAAGDTSWYVGFQPAGQTMQPLIGPVLAGNGLQFQYFDANGAVTAIRTQVARIDITVRARTTGAVRAGGQAAAATIVDSVVTSVALRNNRRF